MQKFVENNHKTKNRITELENELKRLRESESALKSERNVLSSLLETIPSPIFYKDINGIYTGCNEAFEEFIGKSRNEIIGKSVYDMGPRDIADKYHLKDQELLKDRKKQQYEWKVKRADGQIRDVKFDKSVLVDENDNVTGLVGVISDITDQKIFEKALFESNERLEELLSAIPVGIIIIDYETQKILDLNPQAIISLGYTRDEIVGRTCHEYICPAEKGKCPVKNSGKKLDRSEREIINANRELIPVIKSVIQTEIDNRHIFIECFVDISERKRLENQLKELATQDSLTRLYNHKHFIESTEKELSRSVRYDRPLSIIILDIDFFKKINDQFGHSVGDEVLKFLSRICQGVVRENDIIGRIGGEEFAIALVNSDLNKAYDVAERIRHRIESEIFISEGNKITFTVSLGVAEYLKDQDDMTKLMKKADDALYEAKGAGRNRVVKFNQ